uniref:Uncharacterized protein n=1 Tax=Arundo donax TaxID=35708 RepID=A0A0A9FJ43_ARUDO
MQKHSAIYPSYMYMFKN